MVGTLKRIKKKKLPDKQKQERSTEITGKEVRFECGECDKIFDSSILLESHFSEGNN